MDIIVKQAVDAHKEGRLEEAENLYRKILKMEPANLTANYNLGVLLHKLNKLDQAEVNYKKLIELMPDYAEAYNNLGSVLIGLDRLEEAVVCYRKTIELKPTFIEAYNNLGATLHKLGKLDEAAKNYKKAINFNPGYPDNYYNLGITLLKLDKFKEAEINFRKAIELKPDHAEAYANLGVVLKECGRLVEAIDVYSITLRLNPNQSFAKINMIALLNDVLPNKENTHPIIIASRNLQDLTNNFTLESEINNTELANFFQKCNKVIHDANKGLITNETQIYRSNLVNLGCTRHMQIFNEFNIIAKACFDCFKIQIEPKNILEFFKLFFIFDKLELPKNNSRKCMIELRPEVAGTYKGLIYCSSIEETDKILEIISPIINKLTISKIKVKRGCSEYLDTFTDYKVTNKNDPKFMTYKNDWKKTEKLYDSRRRLRLKNKDNSLNGILVLDVLVMNNWLNYAKKIGDKSYKNIDEKIIFTNNNFITKLLSKQLAKRKKEFFIN